MLIAQISDTHVLLGRRLADRIDTSAAFERLLQSLARQVVRPDLILFSGDLGEDATDEEYAYIGRGLRSLGVPVLAVPGNHDGRDAMHRKLPDMTGRTADGFLCLEMDVGPLVVIGLDTIVPGAPHGELDTARLSWLEAAMARHRDRDLLIFQHHPPIVTGLQDLDSMGLLSGTDQLAHLVRRHGRVAAILCGHMHRSIQGICGGAPVRVVPSASHQFAFDLRDGEPFRISAEPAQYAMHLWEIQTGLISHLVPVA